MKKIGFFVCLLVLVTPHFVKAETLQDLYDKLANVQAEYAENKNNKNLTQSQIDSVNTEISTISNSIETTRNEIQKSEEDIAKSKEEIENKKLETDGLIQFLQVSNGGNIYLEYLFDAENYTDFIYRYEVVKQLTNYNSDLIDELEELIVNLQNKEKELEEKNKKLEKERKELSEKLKTLTYNLDSYQSEGVDIEKDIEDLKKQIKVYEDMGCSRTQELSSCTSSVNATGWKYPLAKGCVTSEYVGYGTRYDYSGGSGHHAIDVDCVGEGTNVYAAAAGVVARITKYSCGGNAVYLTHTINGKKYTTVYMHLLSVNSSLYVGKVVTDQTVIGYVGGYSTSTAQGGYDSCTTGAHLHFGIAEGHVAYDFNSHSINPREIFSFPSLVYNGGGYFYR